MILSFYAAFPMDPVHQPLRHLGGARDGLGHQGADTIKETSL